MRQMEDKLQNFDLEVSNVKLPGKELLVSFAQDLPTIWNSPSTDMRLKQRIVRILIDEVVADVNESSREIILLIHWAGGRHSGLRVKKRGRWANTGGVPVWKRWKWFDRWPASSLTS